ncbi:hypothetical protein CY34DRAFT_807167 [Suillus luteus UH-Slu-Lm8-n1]|uniref:Uncharacterized protein n=1 Tax=Suillus luteus UH-Slu-Lm8-n1 TaxID=930992 RepID=A0A0C9ZRU5_9AGAM|nr:hypothetical protein CY34DRAFT_807167 [Suillus luteus UH-Slu-Lm8-n1]
MLSRKPKAGGSHKSKVRVHLSQASPQHRTLNLSYKSSTQPAPESIDLAKGILGTVANILTIAQVR